MAQAGFVERKTARAGKALASFLVAMARKVPQAGTSGEASPDREASGTRSNLSGSEFLFDLCSVVSVLLYQPDGISPFEMVLLHEVPDFIVFATVNRCPVLIGQMRQTIVCRSKCWVGKRDPARTSLQHRQNCRPRRKPRLFVSARRGRSVKLDPL